MAIRTKHFVWERIASLPEKTGAMIITKEARICMLRFSRWGIVRTTPYAITIERDGTAGRISLTGSHTILRHITKWAGICLLLTALFASYFKRR